MTHPFATADFRMAEAEGELGALLRESSDLDAFLEAADRAGYLVVSAEPASTPRVRRLPPPSAAAEGAAAVTGGTDRLAAVGRSLFATFTTDPVVNVLELPDGLGVCLVHAVRGGGKIYVAPDESALVVGSAIDFETGLGAFRDGVRNADEQTSLSATAHSSGRHHGQS